MAYVLIDTYSGSFETNGSYYFCKVYSQQDAAANTSDVKVNVYIQYHTYGSYNSSPNNTTIVIAGNSLNVTTSDWNTDSNHSAQLIATRIRTGIAHNANGTKAITVSCSYDSEVSLGVGSISTGSISLPTIPRASEIGTIPDFNIEDTFSMPVDKKSSSFVDDLVIKLDDVTIKTIVNYSGGAGINFTDNELLTLYNAIDNSATFTFEITTKSGSTTVGADSATTTATAAGTAYIKVNGSWKRALPYIKVDGVWKKAIANIKIFSSWKRGIG